MHDRNYDQLGVGVNKKDTIGKSVCSTTSYICFDNRIKQRIDLDSIKGILNRSKEPLAKVHLLCLIVNSSTNHFRFRIGMEPHGFHWIAA